MRGAAAHATEAADSLAASNIAVHDHVLQTSLWRRPRSLLAAMKTEAQVNILGACSFSRLPRMSRGETYRLSRHEKLQAWPHGTVGCHVVWLGIKNSTKYQHRGSLLIRAASEGLHSMLTLGRHRRPERASRTNPSVL